MTIRQFRAWLFLLALFGAPACFVGYTVFWRIAIAISKNVGVHPIWCLLVLLLASALVIFTCLWGAWKVHCLINRCCWHYAVRHCRKNNLEFLGAKVSPAFKNGVKTEYTAVVCKCRDTAGNLKLVCVIAWIFGIRKVVISDFLTEQEESFNIERVQTLQTQAMTK